MKKKKTHFTIYDFLNGFFREAEREKFSATEVALFTYLIYQVNRQRWWMPFECRTQMMLSTIATTKRQLLDARIELKRRKIINFSEGEASGKPAKYVLIESTLCGDTSPDEIDKNDETQQHTNVDTNQYTDGHTNQHTDGDTDQYTNELTDGNTKEHTNQHTGGDTNQYTHNKIKINNNIKRERELSSLAREETFVGVEILKKELLEDECWQEKMRMCLYSEGTKDLDGVRTKNLIEQFFMYLEANAITIKTEQDCRSHCFNWIKIKLKENGTAKRKEISGCHTTQIGHREPDDYDKSF